MRRGLTIFQRSKIGCPAGEAVRHVRQSHSAVDGSGIRFEAEVEFLRLVDRLHVLEIFRVESWYVHEHVVVSNAMEILTCPGAVVSERWEPARLETRVRCWAPSPSAGNQAAIVGESVPSRRVPLE